MPTVGPSQGVGIELYNVVAQVGDADGDAYRLPKKSRTRGSDDIVIQIDITVGQADVMIQGRVDHSHAWVDMLTVVADEVTTLTTEALQTFAWVPEVRVETTNVANTPTIHVSVHHG
jgi:hypothetical protein